MADFNGNFDSLDRYLSIFLLNIQNIEYKDIAHPELVSGSCEKDRKVLLIYCALI